MTGSHARVTPAGARLLRASGTLVESMPHEETVPLGAPVVRFDGAQLEVVSGPSRGVTARMTGRKLVVGKAPDADLVVNDRGISRRHLSLEALPDGVLLRDLGSRNGTWLGDCSISLAKLTADATLTIGSSSIVVHLEKSGIGLEVSTQPAFGAALGTSVAMRHVFALLERAVGKNVTVLLEGESGTGKEVLARAIHEKSHRAARAFVTIDCASIPENLIESELFGHERGAFTGAVDTHIGAFESASGGTVFLDEIGELPLGQQAKLLRVLENREIRRVGGTKPLPVDVRLVAATNRSLAACVRKQTFRSDLYYRLCVLRVEVPPLRERKEDIPALALHFLKRLRDGSPGAAGPMTESELPADLSQALLAHSWPGNVRELRNVIERWFTLELARPELLFDAMAESVDPRTRKLSDLTTLPYHEAKKQLLEEFDRVYFKSVLDRCGGVIARAAELAQVPRPSFHRMLQRMRGAAPAAPDKDADRDDEGEDLGDTDS